MDGNLIKNPRAIYDIKVNSEFCKKFGVDFIKVNNQPT